MKIKREHAIAGLAIGGVLLLVFGLNYLKGRDLLSSGNIFHVVYGDISGISSASPVFHNGLKVGQVIGTEMLDDGSGRIAVSFQLHEKRLRLTKDSRVQIYSADLLGDRALKVILGTAGEPAQRGDTLQGFSELTLTDAVGQQIDPLKRRAETILASVDSLLYTMQAVLNDSTVGDIEASFSSIRSTLDNLNSTSRRLDALMAAESVTLHAVLENMRRVTANLDSYHASLQSTFANLDTLSGDLASTRTRQMLADLAETSAKLKGITTGLENGEGSLGALLKNDTLYTNLQDASKELDLLLEDLRQNPDRYVHLSLWGRKDKLPKLTDADVKRIKQALDEDKRAKP
jgi:phospholipid/cholesterol/gamma-HCH transport system substrate-binding protein